MKSILIMFALLISTPAVALTGKDLAGSFLVAKLAVEGPYYVVELEVNKAGEAVIFRDANMDYVRKGDECTGPITITNNAVNVDVACSPRSGETFQIEIDTRGVTKKQLESGVKLMVRSNATGGQWLPFQVKKQAKAFLPK